MAQPESFSPYLVIVSCRSYLHSLSTTLRWLRLLTNTSRSKTCNCLKVSLPQICSKQKILLAGLPQFCGKQKNVVDYMPRGCGKGKKLWLACRNLAAYKKFAWLLCRSYEGGKKKFWQEWRSLAAEEKKLWFTCRNSEAPRQPSGISRSNFTPSSRQNRARAEAILQTQGCRPCLFYLNGWHP